MNFTEKSTLIYGENPYVPSNFIKLLFKFFILFFYFTSFYIIVSGWVLCNHRSNVINNEISKLNKQLFKLNLLLFTFQPTNRKKKT
jgi:hypothetical protein